MRPREPCQDRKVAALSGFPHVPEGSLAGAGARRLAGFGSVDGGVRGIYSERGLNPGQLAHGFVVVLDELGHEPRDFGRRLSRRWFYSQPAAFGFEGDYPARFPA